MNQSGETLPDTFHKNINYQIFQHLHGTFHLIFVPVSKVEFC